MFTISVCVEFSFVYAYTTTNLSRILTYHHPNTIAIKQQ